MQFLFFGSFFLAYLHISPPAFDDSFPFSLGVWYLKAAAGDNIQLHFEVFDLEDIYDVVEVRDGKGSDSLLLGKYPFCCKMTLLEVVLCIVDFVWVP